MTRNAARPNGTLWMSVGVPRYLWLQETAAKTRCGAKHTRARVCVCVRAPARYSCNAPSGCIRVTLSVSCLLSLCQPTWGPRRAGAVAAERGMRPGLARQVGRHCARARRAAPAPPPSAAGNSSCLHLRDHVGHRPGPSHAPPRDTTLSFLCPMPHCVCAQCPTVSVPRSRGSWQTLHSALQ